MLDSFGRPCTLGDVTRIDHNTADHRIIQPVGDDGLEYAPGSIRMARTKHYELRVRSFRALVDPFAERCLVLRVHEVEYRLTFQRRCCIAKHPFNGWTRIPDRPVALNDYSDMDRILDKQSEM